MTLFFIEQVKVPIIVAGYKVDVEGVSYEFSIDHIMSTIVKQFPEIERSFKWSAITLHQVSLLVFELDLNFRSL